ncbi:MAG: DUF4956 domain-containing protein [Aureispira sp.]|nr:DUF4956 domain-containing protein [Aureispira sp.]
MEIAWFDVDVYKLLFRLVINIIFVTLIARGIYYPNNNNKDYLFSYYIIGFVTFFLCFSLKKLDIDTGMGLGLFAIFGIIRYRTNTIAIKEMTYVFAVIGLSVINALAANKISITELLITNIFLATLMGIFEYAWLAKHQTHQTTIVVPLKNVESLQIKDLEQQLKETTDLDISYITIEKINYSNKSVQVHVFYLKK